MCSTLHVFHRSYKIFRLLGSSPLQWPHEPWLRHVTARGTRWTKSAKYKILEKSGVTCKQEYGGVFCACARDLSLRVTLCSRDVVMVEVIRGWREGGATVNLISSFCGRDGCLCRCCLWSVFSDLCARDGVETTVNFTIVFNETTVIEKERLYSIIFYSQLMEGMDYLPIGSLWVTASQSARYYLLMLQQFTTHPYPYITTTPPSKSRDARPSINCIIFIPRCLACN